MKVSVILPAYNVEGRLAVSVESIFATGHSPLEILIVEDGSTDKTLAVAERLAESHAKEIKILRHLGGANRGAGASRNLGIRNATGDLIAFLDSDDCYLPNRFDTAPSILGERRDVDGVYEPSVSVDENDDITVATARAVEQSSDVPDEGGIATLSTVLQDQWNTNTITIRKNVFSDVGTFNEALEIGQDTELWIRLVASKVLVKGGCRPVAAYRRHKGNRYTVEFEDDPRHRVRLWISAYETLKLNDKRCEMLVDLHRAIVGRIIYRSDRLRRDHKQIEALRYLIWCVFNFPGVVTNRRFVIECVVTVRDMLLRWGWGATTP